MRTFIFAFAASIVLACGSGVLDTSAGGSASDDNSGAPAGGNDTCNTLCKGAAFTSGKATDYGGGLIECNCKGNGKGVTKSSCESYCSAFMVSAAKSYLSKETIENDKCVCDGTSPPDAH